MNAKTKTLIGAAAALALLIGGYFGAQAWQKKKAESEASSYSYDGYNFDYVRLTDFNSFDIVKIEIPKSPGSDSALVLEKIDDIWELTYPQNRSAVIEQYAIAGKLWTIANLNADKIIDEDPDDLSQFGLDDPQGHAIITDTDGKTAEVFFGDMTPGRNLYYVMVKDDPKVYTAYPYAVESFLFTLDDLRSRELVPEFDPQELIHLVLEHSGTRIEAIQNDDTYPLVSPFASFVLTSPFRQPRGADSEKFSSLMQMIASMYIGEFVDDDPASLAPYGLDRPGTLYFEVPEGRVDLRFGTGADGQMYAKLPDMPGVFTIPGFDLIANTAPFTVADKFIQLFNILGVKDFTVNGDGRTIRSEIQRPSEDEEVFFVNGRRAADQEFRKYYQAVIGLLTDAEYSGPQPVPQGPDSVTVTFTFLDAARAPATTVLTPYDRDFYAVIQNGITEFMVARSQVREIFDSFGRLVYED